MVVKLFCRAKIFNRLRRCSDYIAATYQNDENVHFVIEDETETKEQDNYWLYEG